MARIPGLRLSLAARLGTLALCALLHVTNAAAETIIVATADFAALQAAVTTANTNGDPENTIQILATGTIAATSTLILNAASAKTLTLEGPAFGELVIDGLNTTRLFVIADGVVTFRNLTLANGRAVGGAGGNGAEGGGGGLGAGGALLALAGTLNLENVAFTGNSAAGGAGGESAAIGTIGGGGGGGLDMAGSDGVSMDFGADGGAGGGLDGGAGGIGAIDDSATPTAGEVGGDYSGGGGGGSVGSDASTATNAGAGGTGGFGGGGGGAGRSYGASVQALGGTGGFGGGGGGSNSFGVAVAEGGFAGGAGGLSMGGGGGAALGGAIFIKDGAVLNIAYTSGAPVATAGASNSVVGGTAGGSAADGLGYGSFAFLNGSDQLLTFDVGFPLVRTLDGSIEDNAALSGMGTPATIRKTGLGTLVLSGDGQATDLEVSNGTVQVDGDWSSANITLSAFGRLAGNGVVSDVSTLSNNTVTAGTNFVPGVLATGNLSLDSFGGTLLTKLNGTTAGTEHDLLQVSGTVTLGANSVLVVSVGYSVLPGDSFVVLQNDGMEPIDGTFLDLPEGGFFLAGGVDFQISYVGGDGNDIELTAYVAEIDVLGNGISIPTFNEVSSVADGTDFGFAELGDSVTRTFTITNSGNNFLYLTGIPLVFIGGDNPEDFIVTLEPSDFLDIPDSTTFEVTFQPTGGNVRSAIVSIANSDPDETPYNFVIRGTGPADSDNDGDPDSTDPDDDNDGVLDEDELADGTDPLDPDSKIERLSGTACIDWNGFLASMTQILELRNSSDGPIEIGVDLLDINGSVRDTVNVTLTEDDQFDIVANSLAGFEADTYGQLCVRMISGPASAVNGQLVYYQLTESSFQSAFVTPFNPGRFGSQFLTYNTYYPTQNPTQLGDFAGGYLQISSEEPTTEDGELIFYDQEGSIIRTDEVVVGPNARVDIATHTIGPDQTGLLEWRPTDSSKKFRVVQARYYYDPLARSIQHALSIPAKIGSGKPLTSAFDTTNKIAVLEISNTLSAYVGVNVQAYSAAGVPDGDPLYLELADQSTYHVVLNSLGSGQGATVEVRSSERGGIIAGLIEYGFDDFGFLRFADPFTPKTGFGLELRGSYNNFLGQCTLRVANASAAAVNATLTMVQFDSTVLLSDDPFSVPARGSVALDLCVNQTGAPGYGQVVVVPESPEAIVGAVVRTNADQTAEFSVALTEQ